MIEYTQVSHEDVLIYREHEAEGLTKPGHWFRIDDGAWQGPWATREMAVRAAETKRASSFYEGKAFERQAARDALGGGNE